MCIKKDILAVLAYFDIFDYPLKKREIYVFIAHADELHEFENGLNMLLNESLVFKINEFYSLKNDFSLSHRRVEGNRKASQLLKKAGKVAKFISHFPFVKGVAVSGSLSKNFADDTADIDFFIITTANRLWISRSILHAFKKLTFVFNMQHFFCMNYFIDEAQPEIIEKNIYTATEIVTLLPLRGNDAFEKFYAANSWTKNILPNHYLRVASAKQSAGTWLKYFLEKLFNNTAGNSLDDFLMRFTSRRWQLKEKNNRKNSRGILMSLAASKHFSKPNPANFQVRLLQRYDRHLKDILEQYETRLRLSNEFL